MFIFLHPLLMPIPPWYPTPDKTCFICLSFFKIYIDSSRVFALVFQTYIPQSLIKLTLSVTYSFSITSAWLHYLFFPFVETWSHYVAQAGLELHLPSTGFSHPACQAFL
jgi:hypothetical protein